MAQGSGALLPRLDGMAVEHRVAGEDHRVISLARTWPEPSLIEGIAKEYRRQRASHNARRQTRGSNDNERQHVLATHPRIPRRITLVVTA